MRIILALVLLLTISCEKSDSDKVFANVNGQEIYGKDFLPDIKEQLKNAKNQQQKNHIITKKLAELTTEKVIEYQAQKTGQSKEELLGFFEFIKNRKLDSEEAKIYMAELSSQFKDKKSSGKDELIKAVQNHQYERAKELYIQLLRSKASIKVYPAGKP